MRVWTSRILRRPVLVGRVDGDAAVEAPGPQQRGIEDLGPVGRGEHDHALGAGEAVHLGEDLVERLLALVVAAERRRPPPRERPMASSSSMKMIAGAAFLACSKRSRTRLAPTPTIISMNSEAESEKNGTSASPATARASSVLPVPGGPRQQHALGDRRAEAAVLVGVLEEVDDLDELLLGLVDAGDVVERRALLRGVVALGLRAAEAGQPPPAPPAARRMRKMNRPTSRIVGPKEKSSVARSDGPRRSAGR